MFGGTSSKLRHYHWQKQSKLKTEIAV